MSSPWRSWFSGCSTATPNDALGPYLAERAREEFYRGEVVEVAGWRLARSEARLAALATLLRAEG
ncbi:MAG: hypothetical protein ABI647_15005 [Gemmatimonadota bacterium]